MGVDFGLFDFHLLTQGWHCGAVVSDDPSQLQGLQDSPVSSHLPVNW